MKTDLSGAPEHLTGDEPFSKRIEWDCMCQESEGWRDAMVAINRMIAYINQLEARVAELEKRQS